MAAVLVVLLVVSGCATSAPPPAARPAARPFETVRRVAVIVSGDARFTMEQHSAEPGRTFDEIMKWNSSLAIFRPIAELVHRGINWLLDLDRASDTAPGSDMAPRDVVADAFARALQGSIEFDEIRVVPREPVGEERRRLDAIIRVTLTGWGLVRVREGDPELYSGYCDVRAQMAARDTGVVLWEASEDVTDPERLPLASFTGDRDFTRDHVGGVLERAGQRLATELVYARSGGR
ncbi:MAG TPA: hypothetical protein VFL90_08960 [Methylomirabilota bacterium]|nr:hypothetical protein [Methylomirabilota bacterium]